MTQLLECLPYKHEGLSLDSQQRVGICNLSTEEELETGEFLGPAAQAIAMNLWAPG